MRASAGPNCASRIARHLHGSRQELLYLFALQHLIHLSGEEAMRAYLALAIALLLPSAALATDAQPKEPPKLPVLDVLSVYRDLNDMCLHRSGDGMHALQACNTRDKVSRILNGWGYCYGAQGDEAAQGQWHKCVQKELF
jgi:hypothetical protein